MGATITRCDEHDGGDYVLTIKTSRGAFGTYWSDEHVKVGTEGVLGRNTFVYEGKEVKLDRIEDINVIEELADRFDQTKNDLDECKLALRRVQDENFNLKHQLTIVTNETISKIELHIMKHIIVCKTD